MEAVVVDWAETRKHEAATFELLIERVVTDQCAEVPTLAFDECPSNVLGIFKP